MKTASLAALALSLALLGAAGAFVYHQMLDRISLIGENDNERVLSALFAGLRDYENFGSVIEADESLGKRVVGVAAYQANGASLYSWGEIPSLLDAESLAKFGTGGQDRLAIPDRKHGAIRFVVRTSRIGPPPRSSPESRARRVAEDEGATVPSPRAADEPRRLPQFFHDVLRKSEWVCIDVRHPAYWRERTAMNVLFPLAALAMLALGAYVRFLFLRNAEYRERIEREKNLVVLGTAASTLAHEIKNPLLAIRLQTGILRKTMPGEGTAELNAVDAEVDRISALTWRIGDYLREPLGSPEKVDPEALARETGLRLCGRDILVSSPGRACAVAIDPERFRSALENLVRNALESGGPESAVGIELSIEGGMVRIRVLDRGAGLPAEGTARLFEPFFTTKNRGSGIGLAISLRFVQAAGGTIELLAREGGGAVASILLPETPPTVDNSGDQR